MNPTTTCHDCGAEPEHPGSVARVVGRDALGNVISLCSRCFIRRGQDATPVQMPKRGGKKKP